MSLQLLKTHASLMSKVCECLESTRCVPLGVNFFVVACERFWFSIDFSDIVAMALLDGVPFVF